VRPNTIENPSRDFTNTKTPVIRCLGFWNLLKIFAGNLERDRLCELLIIENLAIPILLVGIRIENRIADYTNAKVVGVWA
jgi:hypothetical protein